MIDPQILRLLMQKAWEEAKPSEGPGELMTLREYSQKSKRLRLKPNSQQ